MNNIEERFEERINNIPYPDKQDFTVYHVMKKGKIIHSGISLDELKKIYHDEFPLQRLIDSKHVFEKEVDEEEYKKCQRQYKESINEVFEEFKTYLFDEYGVSGPKAELLFDICNERTPDSDFYFLEDLFSSFVDLVR